jgi:hypothetical protein
MKAALIHAAPLILLVALVDWVTLDLVRHISSLTLAVGGIILIVAIVAAVYGSRVLQPSLHRASRGLLSVVFIGERLLLIGVDPLPMIGFIVLVMALTSLQSIERTFAPSYQSINDPTLEAKVDSAVVVAYVRAMGLLGFTLLASFLLTLLVPLIGLQSRSLVAAFSLAMLLLLIITLLAMLPFFPTRQRVQASRQQRK